MGSVRTVSWVPLCCARLSLCRGVAPSRRRRWNRRRQIAEQRRIVGANAIDRAYRAENRVDNGHCCYCYCYWTIEMVNYEFNAVARVGLRRACMHRIVCCARSRIPSLDRSFAMPIAMPVGRLNVIVTDIVYLLKPACVHR